MIPVIAVIGPTASGKTKLGVELALTFGGEVVSADSMQIYRGMDIATAKPGKDEMRGIKHHLIDFLPENTSYSVAEYVKDAKKAIADISSRGKTAFVVGGTGLYVDSLIKNISYGDTDDNTQIRKKLRAELEEKGSQALYGELAAIDPQTASRLHPNNTLRVLRALEVYYLTGETMSEAQRKSRLQPSDYKTLYIGIDFSDRQVLYDRINCRVDKMIESGLVKEAKKYVTLSGDTTASQAIGYKELKPYFDGEITFDEACENLKRATRRYAKRQLTWFRRNEEINWVYPDSQPDWIERAKDMTGGFLSADNKDGGENG